MKLPGAIALTLTMAVGVAVNWISALYQPALGFVVAASFLIFFLVTVYERTGEPGSANNPDRIIRSSWANPVRLSFLAFIMAAAITWVTQYAYYWLDWDYRISPPLRIGPGGQFIGLTELTCGLVLTSLALTATFRHRPAVEVICFIVPAMAGLSITLKLGPIQYVFASYNAVGTFLGWLFFSGAVLLVASMRADVLRLLAPFFGARPGGLSNQDQGRQNRMATEALPCPQGDEEPDHPSRKSPPQMDKCAEQNE
ncbi:hypothetical protein OG400_21310 [Micromonospora ureilytica]|uniref:hypothetical protein n=1 Tax=Micromonospora ureilytica TaxID=709868 RepID=UPI002E0DED29|nr:hypothetical protein OG400_21310 [Micromonospora ureilytica]